MLHTAPHCVEAYGIYPSIERPISFQRHMYNVYRWHCVLQRVTRDRFAYSVARRYTVPYHIHEPIRGVCVLWNEKWWMVGSDGWGRVRKHRDGGRQNHQGGKYIKYIYRWKRQKHNLTSCRVSRRNENRSNKAVIFAWLTMWSFL